MARASDRRAFTGIAYLHEPGGKTRPFHYEASFSPPRRDRQGFVRFGWTAIVAGIDKQPQPRTTIVEASAGARAAGWVEKRIHKCIEEHIAVFVGMAGLKI